MFEDIEKFLKVPDEWAPPEIKPYVPGVRLFTSSVFFVSQHGVLNASVSFSFIYYY